MHFCHYKLIEQQVRYRILRWIIVCYRSYIILFREKSLIFLESQRKSHTSGKNHMHSSVSQGKFIQNVCMNPALNPPFYTRIHIENNLAIYVSSIVYWGYQDNFKLFFSFFFWWIDFTRTKTRHKQKSTNETKIS